MTLRRRWLGRSLLEWREHAGISRAEVAAELGCTPDRIRHLESGRNLPTRPDLIVMCAMYRVPESDRAALLETRSEARKPGWWHTYGLPKWLADYVTLEHEASSILFWTIELIPGLLQTERYARKIEGIGDSAASAATVDKRVGARMRRQERLSSRENPLLLDVVISEAALLRCAGDREVGREQLAHLLELSDQENVTIRVLESTFGLHRAMAGGFVLLDFPPDTWPPTLYQEYMVGANLIDDFDVVTATHVLYDELKEQALNAKESISLISQYQDGERG